MLVDVVTEIQIDRPLAEVVAFASDPTNAPRWYANIKSVQWLSPAPVTVGSQVSFVAHFLGRRLTYTYVFTALSPSTLVMRTSEGPFPMETTYEWQAVGDSATRMTLRNRGDPTGFSSLLAPLISAAMRRANRKDLRALKTLLERA